MCIKLIKTDNTIVTVSSEWLEIFPERIVSKKRKQKVMRGKAYERSSAEGVWMRQEINSEEKYREEVIVTIRARYMLAKAERSSSSFYWRQEGLKQKGRRVRTEKKGSSEEEEEERRQKKKSERKER